MNDLDLRTALHRDSDLVGSPSPDLLDQLVQRRQTQRRQRAGMLTAVLAVVVIAAGIPVGSTLLARSDGAPASETTVDPTPSVTPEVTPTPTPVPTPEVTPSATPETNVAVPSAPPVAEVTCPDLDTLQAALPADTPELWFRIFRGEAPVCSGTWAAAGYSRVTPATPDGEAGLWRYVDGSWTFLYRTDCAADPELLPDVIWERACNVD